MKKPTKQTVKLFCAAINAAALAALAGKEYYEELQLGPASEENFEATIITEKGFFNRVMGEGNAKRLFVVTAEKETDEDVKTEAPKITSDTKIALHVVHINSTSAGSYGETFEFDELDEKGVTPDTYDTVEGERMTEIAEKLIRGTEAFNVLHK